MTDLLALGLRALGDAEGHAAFGDAVLEAGWFDERVMPLLYPPPKAPPHLTAAQRANRRHALDRQIPIMHSRENFEAAAGRGSPGFVRACVATMLFGDWQKGRWQITATMIARHKREERERIARIRSELPGNGHGWTWDQLRRRREGQTNSEVKRDK